MTSDAEALIVRFASRLRIANQSGPRTLSVRSGAKKSRPVEWHGDRLCSNTTQERGKRASALERVGYDFCFGARIPPGLPRPGHGIAAMSKAMPNARATATAAAHFPMDRHHAVPSSCSRDDR